MRLQELQHEPIIHEPLVVQPIDQLVMPEGRPPFVHQLRLDLRIEVLCDLADDADQLPLPRLQLRRMLLDEIEKILFGLDRDVALRSGGLRHLASRHRAPEIVEVLLLVRPARILPGTLVFRRQGLRPPETIDAVTAERMARIEHGLDFRLPVLLLARHHIPACEHEVVEDGVRLGPLLKEIISLEERVVPEAGMCDHERLHGHGVLFHEIRDAGVRVDHDFVGERLIPLSIGLLVADELLAIAPVRIPDGQTGAGIGVDHLFGADDLDLVGIRVETVRGGAFSDLPLVAGDQIEIPFRARGDEAHAVDAFASFLNNSRKTG